MEGGRQVSDEILVNHMYQKSLCKLELFSTIRFVLLKCAIATAIVMDSG